VPALVKLLIFVFAIFQFLFYPKSK
jgi:hypothetical protein